MTALTLGVLAPAPALACGGFFCSQTQPVNQAAERIVFAQNGDDTVTAVIEIQYEGPSENFSWLLPISSVPMGDEIAVSSNAAFARLQGATNPQYILNTRVEGSCLIEDDPQRGGNFSASGPGSAENDGSGGVTVEAQGLVGSFTWAVISLDPELAEPADAAIEWLETNGYDVPAGAAGLLGPYLEDGLYLLALGLQKGFDTGSIRPIALTYDGTLPNIPIKLTAVAANDDMGVLTWVLGESQAVPMNYNALELNEARINWFNPSLNYNDVVIAAADDAGGQGFVTEYAQPTSNLAEVVWSSFEEDGFQQLLGEAETSTPDAIYDQAAMLLGGLDGFFEAATAHGTLPSGVTAEQFRSCPQCYLVTELDAQAFLDELETNVVAPMRLLQDLVDSRPEVTRMYTTLSAAEMTVDPLFTFNPDLEPVDNVHNAERIIECGDGDYRQSQAPWRIELPGGGVVRGIPDTVGTWPQEFDEQPPNSRILRQGESGPGAVLDDNTDTINQSLSEYNRSLPTPEPRGGGCGCTVVGVDTERLPGWALLGVGLLFGRRLRRRLK